MFKTKFKKIICIVLVAISACTNINIVYADEATVSWPTPPDIYAEAAIVMDADSGAVIYAKNADEKLYPASITKVVTALLAIENCNVNDTVTINQSAIDALSYDAAKIGVTAGEQISFMDCLYALILYSANDIANALAEHTSGNIDAFVDKMNEFAASVGATSTHFMNPSGLHEDEHYTTARDYANIVREAIKNQVLCKVWGTYYYEMAPTNMHDSIRYLYHRHRMIGSVRAEYYSKVIGGKTGYTDEAGRTLVTYAKDGDMSLICVMLKSDTDYVYTDTEALLEYGFNNFKKVSIDDNETRFFTNSEGFSELLDSMLGTRKALLFLGNGDYALIPKESKLTDFDTNITYNDNMLQSGIVGQVEYVYNDYILGTTSLSISGGSTDYAFGPAITSEETEEENEKENVLIINIKYIALGFLVLILLILVIVFLHMTRDKRKEKRGRKRTFRESRRRRMDFHRKFR